VARSAPWHRDAALLIPDRRLTPVQYDIAAIEV
jgi:hypothetical protein